jgi:hypothetical protein
MFVEMFEMEIVEKRGLVADGCYAGFGLSISKET